MGDYNKGKPGLSFLCQTIVSVFFSVKLNFFCVASWPLDCFWSGCSLIIISNHSQILVTQYMSCIYLTI